SGESMEWPPATGMPAELQTAAPPLRISRTISNAISDVYAMGGKPIMALAILGMPLDKIAPEIVREILKGGAAVCNSAGIPVAGGHSIDSPEPIYGLAVIGICKA